MDNYKDTRKAKYKLDSKERLSKILKKKIQTTMIGALSSIEENFGFLWNNSETQKKTKRSWRIYTKRLGLKY